MPRGYPDFFGQSIFPSWGLLDYQFLTGTILDGATLSGVLVNGKGLVRFIDLIFFGNAGFENILYNFTVDGVVLGGAKVGTYNTFNTVEREYDDMRIKVYDKANSIFQAHFLEGYPFIDSVSIDFTNTDAALHVDYQITAYFNKYV